ncbi:Acetyltransferase, GNAT family [Jannaschia faecimaris]|uniref:Acetyltransferase, GNAT family n=1 Tax=Jannaschia faecimaris TaxID=1244108 RepID=A0A1H3Q9Z8_9RHOB|nr:GNAT family N-acetyltransferase [Jannaschia faecimaris]SDZ10374.1 Acetyltransferase, GNAT family [Jannaschia faecimaris]
MTRQLRRGRSEDLPVLIEVFWRGVHEGAAPRYSDEQRQAWLPVRPEIEAFAAHLANQIVFAAEEGGIVTGFMTMTPEGYLDLAYVLPEARGTGTADALLAMIVNHAVARGLSALTTRASDMARPFFIRHGWQVLAAAPQIRAAVTIPATDMKLPLVASVSSLRTDPDGAMTRKYGKHTCHRRD